MLVRRSDLLGGGGKKEKAAKTNKPVCLYISLPVAESNTSICSIRCGFLPSLAQMAEMNMCKESLADVFFFRGAGGKCKNMFVCLPLFFLNLSLLKSHTFFWGRAIGKCKNMCLFLSFSSLGLKSNLILLEACFLFPKDFSKWKPSATKVGTLSLKLGTSLVERWHSSKQKQVLLGAPYYSGVGSPLYQGTELLLLLFFLGGGCL